MPRLQLLLVLLSVWLFAIFAPPVISVFSEDGNPLITINLNEEEPQEQAKKDLDEKVVLERNFANYILLAKFWNSSKYFPSLLKNSDNTSEIVLPPPEKYI